MRNLRLLSIAGFLSACALTGPPVAPTPLPSNDPRPTLAVIEGQPGGLLVELQLADTDTDTDAELALLRAAGDADSFDILYRFDGPGPVRFLDPDVSPQIAYRYAAGALREGAVVGSSEVAEVAWIAPPAPARSVAAAPLGAHVEVTWEGCAACGGVVFRRRLGERTYTRLVPVDSGVHRFIDAPPVRGALFGYKVSQIEWTGAVPVLGPTSAEVVVETMPVGTLRPPDDAPPD